MVLSPRFALGSVRSSCFRLGSFEGFPLFFSFLFASCPVRNSSSGIVHSKVPGSFSFVFGLSPLRFGRVRSQPLRLPFFGLHLGSLSCSFPGFSRCLGRSRLSFFPGCFATFRRFYFPLFPSVPSLLPVAYLLSHRSRGGVSRISAIFFYGLCRRLYSSLFPALLPCARKISLWCMQPCPFFGSKGVR